MKDHLGSTKALTYTSGAIVSSTSYDSFGNATTSIPTSYQYTGREYDVDTGLYYYRNRRYDPEIGRFISEDPIGFAGGDVNLYSYVWNSPYNFTDPFGFQGSGKELADLLDNKIEKARLGAQGDASNWVWNATVNTLADLARIGSDVLRLGSGIGCALFNDRASASDKAWAVAADIGRGLTIPGAGIAARMAFRAAKGVGKAASRAARASRGTAKGESVIGPRSTYREFAEKIGANFLDVTDEAWTMQKNIKFLQDVVKRGDDVVFAGKYDPLKLKTKTVLAKEIRYLQRRGYSWNKDFTRLIKK